MAELVVFGIVQGEEVSKCDDATKNFVGLFYSPHKSGVLKNYSRRPNNDMIYTYVVYENEGKKFITAGGRSGSHFGMSLVFHGTYVEDANKVFQLLEKTYDEYVKNKIIQETPDGNRKWLYSSLATPGDEIAIYLSKGLARIMKQNPELNLDDKVRPLPPLQNQTQRY